MIDLRAKMEAQSKAFWDNEEFKRLAWVHAAVNQTWRGWWIARRTAIGNPDYPNFTAFHQSGKASPL